MHDPAGHLLILTERKDGSPDRHAQTQKHRGPSCAQPLVIYTGQMRTSEAESLIITLTSTCET